MSLPEPGTLSATMSGGVIQISDPAQFALLNAGFASGSTIAMTWAWVTYTALNATPSSLSFTIGDGPQAVTITGQEGLPLPTVQRLAATSKVSGPRYVVATPSFGGGQMYVYPEAVGAGVVRVTYGDEIDDEVSVDIPFTVTP